MHLFEGFDIAQIIHDDQHAVHGHDDDVISVSSDSDHSDVNDDFFDVVVFEVGENELNFMNEYNYGDGVYVDENEHVVGADDVDPHGNDDSGGVGDDEDFMNDDDDDEHDVGVIIQDGVFDYGDVNMENDNDDDDDEHDVVNIEDRAFDYDDEDEDVDIVVNFEDRAFDNEDEDEDVDIENGIEDVDVHEYAESLSASSSVHSNTSSHHHDELCEVYDLVGPCGDDEWTVGGDAGLEIDVDGQETYIYLHHPPAHPVPVHPLQHKVPLPSCPSDSLLVRKKRKASDNDNGSMAKRSRSESCVAHRKFTRARRVNARRVNHARI